MVSAVVYFDSSTRPWIPSLFAVAALLVPFVGYMAAVYNAPWFGKWSRSLKTGVLTLASIIFTITGYTLLFAAGLWVRGDFHIETSTPSESGVCICGVTNWSKFSPEGGGFSVLMPFRPTASTTTNDTPAGSLVLTSFTAEPSRVVAFSVLRNRFPSMMSTSNKQKMFEAGLKSALGADGTLVSDTAVQLHGYAGHEWKFAKFKRKAVITMRIYLIGHELFQAICVMPKSRFCSKHSREFLDSFDFTGETKNGSDAQ